jgi:peptide/nickel transport system permease protein
MSADLAVGAQTPGPGGQGRWRRLFRGSGLIGTLGILLLLSVAAFAPLIAPYDPNAHNIANTLAPPVWSGGEMAHLLGTDGLGRDVLSRLIYGARSSVMIAVFAMLIGMTLGVVTGLTAGFFGNVVDSILMRFGDVQLALPFILIAIVVLGMMSERSPIHLIVVLGIPAWIVYARVVRSKVLSERERAYVRAAETFGANRRRRMFRYILPQVWGVVPPIILVDLSNLIIMEATLSFLGFGLTPPHVSWGQILADGRQNMVVSPWLPILPGIAIMLSVLALNLAVEGMRPPLVQTSRADLARRQESARLAKSDQLAEASAPGDHPRKAPLLEIRDLEVEFPVPEGPTVRAVRGASLTLDRGKILGVVGESGSGKSVMAWATLGLLTPPGRVVGGFVTFDGLEVTTASESTLRKLRGSRIGMMFQNPSGSLNPVFTVGHQITETIRTHLRVDKAEARRLAREALLDVGFGDPDGVLKQYPFRLSGGQNQRVVIAMTMVLEPDLLLADEPTTALDVTTQAQVLDQLRRLRDEHGTSILLISHDIGLIAETADDVVVMYAGEICESGPAEQVIASPRHPYTQALLNSVPAGPSQSEELKSIPGDLPDPATAARDGCVFADRCPSAFERCHTETPRRWSLEGDRTSQCHLVEETAQQQPTGRVS